jgi:sporulation protein YlmC with PRC-barrel domain
VAAPRIDGRFGIGRAVIAKRSNTEVREVNIELGATVRTKDGERAGTVTKVIWDPAQNQVREFVIHTGALLGHDVIVSRDVLERATADGKELVIDLTKHELKGLGQFEDHAYAPPPYGFLTPVESKYASADLLFPLATADTQARPRDMSPAQGWHRHSIKKGMPVKNASGQVLGVVDELRVDDMTGELRSIVVREDGLAPDAVRMREIPADQVDIGDDAVHLIEESRGRIAGRDS